MTMKRIMAWLISLVLGLVVTFVIFEYTVVDIPFMAGGVFTAMTVLMMALFFSFFVDMGLKAGLYDERGWHLGLFDPMGPLGRDDTPPPSEYKPILSREERLKKKKG